MNSPQKCNCGSMRKARNPTGGNAGPSRKARKSRRLANAIQRTSLIQSEPVPIARSYSMTSSKPLFQAVSGNVTRIRNHELIGDVNGSTSFTATKYSLNPGLPLFPWLAQRSLGWEKYRFRRCCLHYVPSNAVTTTPGGIWLAADYDPNDAAPSTLASLSAYETLDDVQVHRALSLSVSVRRMFDGIQHKKIRCGPVGGDLQLYDGCSLIVATTDCSNSDPIGKLYLEYEIDLISPQVEPSLPIPPNVLFVALSADQVVTTSTDTVVNFDTSIVEGFALVETDGAITLPCGQYRVSGVIYATSSSAGDCNLQVNPNLDGAALVPPRSFGTRVSASSIASQVSVPFLAYVRSDGSNVFTIVVSVTASGTLTVRPSGSVLLIEAL